MARGLHEKFVLIPILAGCLISFCSVSVTASSMRFTHDTFISYEVSEGENVTIDCSTDEPAYYTTLSFHHSSVPPFYLAPDGKKIIQKEQIFTILNVTQQNQGTYKCEVKDKDLKRTSLKAAEIIIIFNKAKALNPSLQGVQANVVTETATMKVSQSKPYLYFKQKSPLRKHVSYTKPLELSFSVKGLQPIKMQWKKDDHDLMIGARYKTFDNGRQLRIDPPFTLDDSGIYSVSACNSKGCSVRGAQVLFYATKNSTQDEVKPKVTERSKNFIETFLQKYGIVAIPTVVIIILIIAIACAARSPSKKKKEKIKEITKEIHIHKNGTPAQGVGRSASLWSWHSDEHSSPDELPDYDKMKSTKKGTQRHRQQTKEQEPDYTEMQYEDDNYSDHGDSYNSRDAEHSHLKEHHYEDDVEQGRETLHREDYLEHETNYSTRNDLGSNWEQENHGQRYSHEKHYDEEDIYDTIENIKYAASKASSIKDENNNRTNTHRSITSLSQGYNNGIDETKDVETKDVETKDVETKDEDIDEPIYASFADQMRGGIQPLKAHLLQNTESAQAYQATVKARTHSVDIHDDDDDDDDIFEDASNDVRDFHFDDLDIKAFD